MLPGFRFLFVATVMSVSVLVFALGAAALLRATHENFATLPQRRPPEQVFVKTETTQPVIALLRVEAEPAKASIAAAATVARDEMPTANGNSETAAAVSTPSEPALVSPDTNASPATSDGSVPGPLAALNTELTALAERRSATPSIAATPPTETPAPAVIEPAPDVAGQAQPAPASDQAATTGSVKVAALSDGGDVVARIADARKKAEAAQIRTRNVLAARRARAAKIAAQRRRIAIIRAREAKQKQLQEQQQPFAPLFNTN